MSSRSTAVVIAIVASALVLASPAAWAREVDATDVTEAGLHASLTTVQGGDKSAQLGAFGLSNSHVGFGYERPATIRVINTASLAGGPDGIQGGIANAVAGGLRVPFGKQHGLVLRAGFEASFFGNKYVWNSLVELPQVQVGYQWLVPGAVADFAMKGGYVLLGRHNTGDAATRNLGRAFEWGAISTVHLGPVDLRASYGRIYARYGGTPVNLLEGAFCGDAVPIVVCTELRYELGDVRVPDGTLRDARVAYVGMTVGLVLFEKKPDKK